IEPFETAEAKLSELWYRVIGQQNQYTLVEVKPKTGRMHQIRIQFASRGCPILGDQLYGASQDLQLKPLRDDYTHRIALHVWKLQLKHPVRYDDLDLNAPVPEDWPGVAKDWVRSLS